MFYFVRVYCFKAENIHYDSKLVYQGRRKCMVEFLSRYIVLVVLGICLCLGYIIKHSISFIPNKFIPLILGVVGIILNVWINNWTITPEIILGGLVSGLASTGAFEMVRNIVGKSETVANVVTQEHIKKR